VTCRHYTVENARVYDLPRTPPRVLASGFGPKAINVAARIGDGFVTTRVDGARVDELYVRQIGPEQDAFFAAWAPAVLPRFTT
jgi:alkanesulfonate monooxygenase SsuD/methylene tetrahydromethanopterin reductase-like flavin-dependent oxidoreductase (luciferase family)